MNAKWLETYPRGGVDYPESRETLDTWTSDEARCIRYISDLRWPNILVCPNCCKIGEPWEFSGTVMTCPLCGKPTSITRGTIFHDSRHPLSMWLKAIWAVTRAWGPINASQLQREVGLRSYKTAWKWYHILQKLMVEHSAPLLYGEVAVDEFVIAHSDRNNKNALSDPIIVAVAIERYFQYREKRPFRIKMQCLDDVNADALRSFIRKSVKPRATIFTDRWVGYSWIGSTAYKHKLSSVNSGEELSPKMLKDVNVVAADFKKYIESAASGCRFDKNVEKFIGEFVFRYNHQADRGGRLSREMFYSLVSQAILYDNVDV